MPDPPAFDASIPNPARMWNYWPGGKDNISQEVPVTGYSALLAAIQ